jgi:hypothetical protein
MGKRGHRQQSIHKVYPDRVSPDDVVTLLQARDQRLRADQRSDLERHFGDPDYSRSALAEYRQREAAKRAPPSVGDDAIKTLMRNAMRGRR